MNICLDNISLIILVAFVGLINSPKRTKARWMAILLIVEALMVVSTIMWYAACYYVNGETHYWLFACVAIYMVDMATRARIFKEWQGKNC
jgi:Na+/H+ antiporter NhaD/arsenite permease-like protein